MVSEKRNVDSPFTRRSTVEKPKNRFENHATLTLSLAILFVLGVVELISFALLQTDQFEPSAKSLEIADFKEYDAWALYQHRPNQSIQFNFKGVVSDAEFGIDE